MEPALRLIGVTKRFGRQLALDNVSLAVPRGSVCALLGENGAGKTTAMRLLTGLARPDAGRTEVLGRDSQVEGREIRRRVGYVPERPALYEWMTIGETGWFAAPFHGGRFWARYQELVKGFELPLDRKIKAVSKGMRAKVVLSLALASDPDVLLLDEPTSGLDPLVRREFLESMVNLAAEGRTVFISSHQIAEVERVANLVAILRKGRLVLVEEMERIKEAFREVIVTYAGPPSKSPFEPDHVIDSRTEGRQQRLIVRDVEEGELIALGQREGIVAVDARTPSLEELFVAVMTTSRPLEAQEVAR